ncbi:MAG: replication protein RepA [Candidatus Aenigmatarchaeota archaeon]
MPETLDSFIAPRRLAAKEKNIKDITKNDVRVKIVGRIIDVKENILVIDDGTGKATITYGENINLKPHQIIRVFGRVIPTENGFEIEGEIVQNMDNLNISLYKKLLEMERNL